MASRWRPARALLSVALAAFACEVEEPSTLEIAVVVEPSTDDSAQLPAEVLVGFDSSGSGYLVFRVGFLCPRDARFSTTATLSAPAGGDAPAAVDAWLVPVEDGAFACGPLAAPERVASSGRPRGTPRTSARFQVVGGCGAGDVRFASLTFR